METMEYDMMASDRGREISKLFRMIWTDTVEISVHVEGRGSHADYRASVPRDVERDAVQDLLRLLDRWFGMDVHVLADRKAYQMAERTVLEREAGR